MLVGRYRQDLRQCQIGLFVLVLICRRVAKLSVSIYWVNKLSWSWDHIRFFLALAEHGTLSSAAKSLNVSHSTVQRRVRSFEEELQAHLFDHASQGYTLTAAGESLYAEALKMRVTMDTISREITGADKKIEGEVSITSTDTLCSFIIPAIVANIKADYPSLRFIVRTENSFSNISHRESDIAIRTGLEPPDNLIGRKVGEIRFAMAASPAYIANHNLNAFPENVNDHRFIILNDGFSHTSFYQWLDERLQSKVCDITQTTSIIAAAALAKAGVGMALLPQYIIDQEDQLVELAVEDNIPKTDLWVLSHVDLRDVEKIRVVRQQLHKELPRFFS